MNKIAFLFLLIDKIKHQDLWEKFFLSDFDGKRHTIYSHPKIINEKTPEWIIKNKVRTVKTAWCSENLLKAFCNMLKKALKDKSNKYFSLLSGDCIPLFDFDETYKRINKTKKSRLYYYTQCMFEDKYDYYAYQWMIINRKVAKDLIRLYDTKDKVAKKFIRSQRKRFKDHGVKIGENMVFEYPDTRGGPSGEWHGGCPDELYPIEWFIKLYGKPNSEKFKKNIINQRSTWIEWIPSYAHPYIINKSQLKKWRKNICTSNAIFARKFTKTAAKEIGMKC